ncbi:MAG: PAS domain-containing protein [Planctomycetota bacterium]
MVDKHERRPVPQKAQLPCRAELLEIILSGMSETVVVRSEDYEIVYNNRAAIEESSNREGQMCYHSNMGRTRPCKVCEQKMLLDGKVSQPLLYTNLRPDGSEMECKGSIITLPDGRRAMLTVARSVEEKKRLARELRIKDSAIASSINAVALVGLDGKVTYVNDSFLEMWEYKRREEVLGRPVAAFCESEDEANSMFEALHRKNRWMGELVAERKDGSPFYAQLSASIVEDEIGQPICMMASFIDVTKRKQAKEDLRKLNDALERRVMERTADLTRANEILEKQIAMRKKAASKLLEYQEQLRSLASELSLAEERERRRIAMYLHDNTCQNLVAAKIRLEKLVRAQPPDNHYRSLDEVVELLEQAVQDTRSLSFEISPPMLHELGFEPAVEFLVEQMRDQHDIILEFHDDGQSRFLDEDVRTVLFQAARELLVNIVKHANARKAAVDIQSDGSNIRIAVDDDGVGFDTAETASRAGRTGGFGLFSVRERLRHLGGRFDIESRPGCGTRATLLAPLKRECHNTNGG